MSNVYKIKKVNTGEKRYQIVRTEVVPPFDEHILFTLTSIFLEWSERLEFRFHLGDLTVSLYPEFDTLVCHLNDLKTDKLVIVRNGRDYEIFYTGQEDGQWPGLTIERQGDNLMIQVTVMGQVISLLVPERDLLQAVMDLAEIS